MPAPLSERFVAANHIERSSARYAGARSMMAMFAAWSQSAAIPGVSPGTANDRAMFGSAQTPARWRAILTVMLRGALEHRYG